MIDPVVGLATLATVVVHRERERERERVAGLCYPVLVEPSES